MRQYIVFIFLLFLAPCRTASAHSQPATQNLQTNVAYEYIDRMYGSSLPGVPVLNALRDIVDAYALTSQKKNTTTALYLTAFLLEAIDTMAWTGTAFTKRGSEEVSKLSRVLFGLQGVIGGLQLLLYTKFIQSADSIARAARQHTMRQKLKDVRNIRIKNGILRIFIFLGLRVIFDMILNVVPAPKMMKSELAVLGMRSLIWHFIDDLILQTSREQRGIEFQLIHIGEKSAREALSDHPMHQLFRRRKNQKEEWHFGS